MKRLDIAPQPFIFFVFGAGGLFPLPLPELLPVFDGALIGVDFDVFAILMSISVMPTRMLFGFRTQGFIWIWG
tara:strand:+ start:498 stop:716 length:219 start_codon:yes stop_codon:yes gene_type:complete